MNIILNFVNSIIKSKKNDIKNYFEEKYFPSKEEITPKIEEITIQTATYNKIIPLVYGINKVAGNIIWLSDPWTSNSSYYLNFALCLGKGEIKEIKNFWINGELKNITDYTHRFYKGTEEQEPDISIKNSLGENKTPAFRGLSYIVFQNFCLSNFSRKIPTFTFEAVRERLVETNANNLENTVKSLTLLPFIGEFVYSKQLQVRSKYPYSEDILDTNLGEWIELNDNTNTNIADAKVSIDELLATFKNLEWVTIGVTWFLTSDVLNSAILIPKIEFKYHNNEMLVLTKPKECRWSAGGYTRYTATMLNNSSLLGTPSDESILSLCKYLREEKNIKVMFRPDFKIDIATIKNKDEITLNVNQINNFFIKDKGYNTFILNYANLLKNDIDAFLIGNDLSFLTKQYDNENSFPAVNNLIKLAEGVKNILHENVLVSYSANFDEYHHHKETKIYNLDPLWASENIDFIGVKAYFKLTSDFSENINKNTIKEGWESGIDYDYIYSDKNLPLAIEARYAIKNLKFWWENKHFNPDNTSTSWLEKSKKIWFTEYGFPSINCSTNDPFSIYQSKNIPDDLPSLSNGESDFFIQRLAIESTEEFWNNYEFIENKFLYGWDMRPYPALAINSKWQDYKNWQYSYCLNGKLNGSIANSIIRTILKDAGLDENIIGKVEIDEYIYGFIINNNMSVNDIFLSLQKVYFFDYLINKSKIDFISQKNYSKNISKINHQELLPQKIQNKNIYLNDVVIASLDLPKRIVYLFIDSEENYKINSVYAELSDCDSAKVDIEQLPFVINKTKARDTSETNLYSLWNSRNVIKILVNYKYLFLNVGDLIQLENEDSTLLMKITKISYLDNKILEIIAQQHRQNIYVNTINILPPTIINNKNAITTIKIFELPNINSSSLNKIVLYFNINYANGTKWDSGNLYHSNNLHNYKLLKHLDEISISGECLNILPTAKPYYFDTKSTLKIAIKNTKNLDNLQSINFTEITNLKNLALVGSELIQFQDVIKLDDNVIIIKNLIRGLFNTEKYISTHKNYETFTLLDNSISQQEFAITEINKIKYYKINTINLPEQDFSLCYKVNGENLKPFTVAHL